MDNSSAQIVVILAESKTAKKVQDQVQMWRQRPRPKKSSNTKPAKTLQEQRHEGRKVCRLQRSWCNGSFHV